MYILYNKIYKIAIPCYCDHINSSFTIKLKTMKKLVIRQNETVTSQLESFNKEQNSHFTALCYLKKPDDIKRYFIESVDSYKKHNPIHPDAREAVRASLAYIAVYGQGLSLGFERFREVLDSEFDDARKVIGIWRANEITKTNLSIAIPADKKTYPIRDMAKRVEKGLSAPRYGAFTLNKFYNETFTFEKDISGTVYMSREYPKLDVQSIIKEARKAGFYKEFELGEALLLAEKIIPFFIENYQYEKYIIFMLKGSSKNEIVYVFSPEKNVVAVKIGPLDLTSDCFRNFVFM